LELAQFDIGSLPKGVAAERRAGEVRYFTRQLQVGFSVFRTGFSFLGIDEAGHGKTETNLLQRPGFRVITARRPLRDHRVQGFTFERVGYEPELGALETSFVGHCRVNGNRVSYEFALPESGQLVELTWMVEPGRLSLDVSRVVRSTVRALTT
jgi:hypothetical protein